MGDFKRCLHFIIPCYYKGYNKIHVIFSIACEEIIMLFTFYVDNVKQTKN